MATKAKAAKGTTLKRGDGGGSEVFTTIGEVTSIGSLNPTVAEIDATSYDSAAAEVISSGLPDYGELSIDFNWVGDNAQQQGLETDLKNGTLRNFELQLNDQPSAGTTKTKYAFAAIVKSFSVTPGAPTGKLQGSATLRISGLPTKTLAA